MLPAFCPVQSAHPTTVFSAEHTRHAPPPHAGNNPWPIGVTSVGIHERSAREKISHVMNAAHIMNDEATRKFLQAIKRLLTFLQRMYPTDPSRCVDFDAHRDAGRGSAGSGSDKLVRTLARAC